MLAVRLMRRPDGREVLVRLAYPLPLNVVPELLSGIAQGAEAAGYTNVCIDANDNGAIIATPPDPSRCRCSEYDHDRDTPDGCYCGHRYDQHSAGGQFCHAIMAAAPQSSGGER